MALLVSLTTGCDRKSAANAGPQDTAATAAAATAPAMSPAERGKYLVTIIGCNDCHTPYKMGPNGPEPDMTRMLSGHPETFKISGPPKISQEWLMTMAATGTAFAGPWGISYTMNLTPDSLTGLGTWTEDIFMKTLRTGKHWGAARPIMPPMPWQGFSKMTDEDLKAIYAFLRTIPPIKNQPPAYTPPSGPMAAAPAPDTAAAH
jgi:hypothetical protein